MNKTDLKEHLALRGFENTGFKETMTHPNGQIVVIDGFPSQMYLYAPSHGKAIECRFLFLLTPQKIDKILQKHSPK